MSLIIYFKHLLWKILHFELDFIPIFLLAFNEFGEKIIFITLEFFCVAYLLLIIDIPSWEGISELAIFKHFLKLPFHSAPARFIDGIDRFIPSIGFILLYGWLLGRAWSTASSKVLLEMMIFGSELTIGVMIWELFEEC